MRIRPEQGQKQLIAFGSGNYRLRTLGHGMEVGGENWLIPTDAELRSDADVESEAVSLRSVNLQVAKARQLGLVILDACRNNPFASKMKRSLGTRAVERGLARTEPTDNVLVAYSARDGTTASDGTGRNSPFTTALLRNIETPGLEISFLFRRVRGDVMSATKREQQPFVYGSLSKEEIYLVHASSVVGTSRGPSTHAASIRRRVQLLRRRLALLRGSLSCARRRPIVMSYVERVLQPGEQIRHISSIHWIVYWAGVGVAFLAAVAYWLSETRPLTRFWLYMACVLALIAVALLVQEWFKWWITEIAVTNRRVIYKKGFIRRQTNEMNVHKVESVQVHQPILGRMLGYGTVTILGTGAGFGTLRTIAGPIELRNSITGT
jgi:hypothetical protein